MNFDGVEVTYLHTDTAADADVGVDMVDTAALAGDGVDGAVAGANGTAGAGIGLDDVLDEGLADLGGTAFFLDVGFIFITEIFQGALYGIGCGLTEAAHGGVLNGLRQLLQKN